MIRLWAVVLALLGASCTANPHALYGTKSWQPRGVHLTIPPDAPDCAWWAALSAWDYLRPTAPLVIGLAPTRAPSRGEIVFEWAEPGHTWKGVAITAHVQGAPIQSTIRVKSCETRLFAHELGHALGLADTPEPGRLMSSHYPVGGWALTAREIAILRPVRPVRP